MAKSGWFPQLTDAPAAGMIAYFSMEIAIDDGLPTYSGGLGVLAGDHLRSAADASLPMVGVTLVYHRGFFRQAIDGDGRQVEHDVWWDPASRLERVEPTVTIGIRHRQVTVGAWRLDLRGAGGSVPVYFLDTNRPENHPDDRAITDRLYTGEPYERLSQEAVLGLAGPLLLAQLGHEVERFHMNEGHASLVPLAVLAGAGVALGDAEEHHIEALRRRCVFTTHTPVPAGHDRFSLDTAGAVLGPQLVDALGRYRCVEDGALNMTLLGMAFAGFVNGVAQRHGQVSQAMFPQFQVQSITNGVHIPTWAAPSTVELFDRHLRQWRTDNALLRYAGGIPLAEIRAAHRAAKAALVAEVRERTGVALDPELLTVGVARRSTSYKRNDLLLSQPERLRAFARRTGGLQVLYSGKSHPLDGLGKDMIQRVTRRAVELVDDVRVLYLADYGMHLATCLVAGVDLWLNTPLAPHEASGTSGMKAALNGVPSLSVLDGWWVEGHVEGVTGWAIGVDAGGDARALADAELDRSDADHLYLALEQVVGPLFSDDPDGFARVGRGAIALNGSFFNTERMVREYATRAYGLGPATASNASRAPGAVDEWRSGRSGMARPLPGYSGGVDLGRPTT